MIVAFIIAGTLSIIATLMAVSRLSAVHALLYLIGSLLSLAVAFYTLGAPYAAVLEVMVYAGAIVVLLLFVVMIMNLGARKREEERELLSPSVWIGPAIVVLLVAVELAILIVRGLAPATKSSYLPAEAVNAVVFGPYILGVELVSFLLLAGVVSAFHLGRRKVELERHGTEQAGRGSEGPEQGPGTDPAAAAKSEEVVK
ncbi:NADH-quinone oxidoreductase subunit J [Salinispira pacifica]